MKISDYFDQYEIDDIMVYVCAIVVVVLASGCLVWLLEGGRNFVSGVN